MVCFSNEENEKELKRFSTQFFNSPINVQLAQNGEIHKIFHTEHLAMLLKVDNRLFSTEFVSDLDLFSLMFKI